MKILPIKFVLIVILFLSFHSFSKDLFQFDLRDYGMSWGMTRDNVIKLDRKEIIENGTKIIFEDDKGKKFEGHLEYDKKGELFKIWFNIIDEAKPKNYEEYKLVKKLFVSKYRSYVKRLTELYGNNRLSSEIDDHGSAFEHNYSGISMNSYNSDWIYQLYTLINIVFNGGDTVGYELVLQFISFRGYYEEIKQYNKDNS